jgi:hypothetical protein
MNSQHLVSLGYCIPIVLHLMNCTFVLVAVYILHIEVIHVFFVILEFEPRGIKAITCLKHSMSY